MTASRCLRWPAPGGGGSAAAGAVRLTTLGLPLRVAGSVGTSKGDLSGNCRNRPHELAARRQRVTGASLASQAVPPQGSPHGTTCPPQPGGQVPGEMEQVRCGGPQSCDKPNFILS